MSPVNSQRRLRLAVCGGMSLIVGSMMACVALAGVAAKAPTCSTVSASIINATIGGGAKPVLVSSSSNGQLDCDYGGTHGLNIDYRTGQTAATFKLILGGHGTEQKIAGI